jgi:hypothetical protein
MVVSVRPLVVIEGIDPGVVIESQKLQPVETSLIYSRFSSSVIMRGM